LLNDVTTNLISC